MTAITGVEQEAEIREIADSFEPPLDAGIARFVAVLRSVGINTYESCEGGPDHSYPEPTICFHGDRSEGFRALAVALQHDLPVAELRRVWSCDDGEPVGPEWAIVFWKTAPQ